MFNKQFLKFGQILKQGENSFNYDCYSNDELDNKVLQVVVL